MAEHTHHDDHYHQPGLQHQFDDMEQQMDSVTIGMWAFLAQEIMFFGGLFTVYLVFRSKFPLAFAAGSNHLDPFWGGLNTLVLIVSSLTMALAVYYAQKSNRNMQVIMIVLTMIFGTVFLGVKAVEYTGKYQNGQIPVDGWNMRIKEGEHKESASFVLPFEVRAEAAGSSKEAIVNPSGNFIIPDKDVDFVQKIVDEYKKKEKDILTESEKFGYFDNVKYKANGEVEPLGEISKERLASKIQIFFWIYFVMTGLHALHMIIGLGIMLWLLYMAWKSSYSAEFYSPVEISGLYWHFVDIVWIFLFPLLYLLGRHFLAGGGGH